MTAAETAGLIKMPAINPSNINRVIKEILGNTEATEEINFKYATTSAELF